MYHNSPFRPNSPQTEYVVGLISFASTVIFLFTLDISGSNRFCIVAWYLSSIILHLEYTDAYSPHQLHIEIEESSDVQFKQRAVIEFLTAEKVLPIEIHRRMQAVYGDQCVDVSTVRRWVTRFKDGQLGQADLSDRTRSEGLGLHQDRVEELIRGNRRIKQKEIAVALGISKERVGHIIGVLGLE